MGLRAQFTCVTLKVTIAYMFDRMGHSGHVRLIAEVADINIHGGARLVGLGIMNQSHLHLVRQPDDPIGAVI